ncbi:MAG: hydroxyacid dehydrogenase [Chthoniobacteraceae bacterium]
MPGFEQSLLARESKGAARVEEEPVRVNAAAVYFLAEEVFEQIYGCDDRAIISSRVKTSGQLITPQDYQGSPEIWPEVEMIFSGWGMVQMDEGFFRRFPKLKVVFYAAGTVKSFVTEAFWRRKIRLTNAAAANAVPVSEFTISQILFALKHGWQQALFMRKHGEYPPCHLSPGAYQTTVGLISLGAIGSLVAERLRQFDMNVVAYDPFFPQEKAEELNVTLLPLEEVFAISDVVSCHAPVLSDTERMIRGRHFESMKTGATFINTARGIIVDEEEMIDALKKRPDLFAILDVTEPMPPAAGSPLYALENVVMTPHIAGSLGHECRRMGRLMVEELDRYLAGEPLRYEIDEAYFQTMA